MTQSAESFGNYELIKRVELDFTDVVVSKWKSSVTGLTVIHVDYESMFCFSLSLIFIDTSWAAPLVDGYFVVATESKLQHFILPGLYHGGFYRFRRLWLSSHARTVCIFSGDDDLDLQTIVKA
jgi:hypothetical protein